MFGIIILAAGQGKRMCSKKPKVMHAVAGKMMIDHILETVQPLNPDQIVIVASRFLLDHYDIQNADCVVQEQPLGTADAVQCGLNILNKNIKKVLILCGDTPLVQESSLKELVELTKDLSVMGMQLPQQEVSKGYGRFIIENEDLKRIVEMKDATKEEQHITLANAGIYCGTTHLFKECLPLIKNENQASEYYLTDIVELARQKKYRVHYSLCPFEDTIGVNSRSDLAIAETIMQSRLRQKHMQNGVTLIDPSTVYFQKDTQIGKDVTIYPSVFFGKNVNIEDDVIIYDHCHLESCHLMTSSKVGPFAHLRGGVTLHEKAEVGNFVELKKTILHQGAKAKHLSYLGDAEIGAKANIGAGTITCNYNGFIKQKTIIGAGAFIGSNSALIAPVHIGKGAIVAAGSTITQDVSEEALAIARTVQTEKPHWAISFRKNFDYGKMDV